MIWNGEFLSGMATIIPIQKAAIGLPSLSRNFLPSIQKSLSQPFKRGEVTEGIRSGKSRSHHLDHSSVERLRSDSEREIQKILSGSFKRGEVEK